MSAIRGITMREILFRGKRKDNGEWVYGDLIHSVDCVKVRERETDINRIAKSYEVIPETVGQFTGLKDINGKKIFEGDILQASPNSDVYIGHVYYENAQWFGARDNLTYAVAYSEAEVIDNIHDNKELFKDLMKYEILMSKYYGEE